MGVRSGPAQAARAASPRRIRAAQPLPMQPPLTLSSPAGQSPPLPPSPSQDNETALDTAKEYSHTEVIELLEKYDLAAQVSRAAPRRAATSPLHAALRSRAVYRATGT